MSETVNKRPNTQTVIRALQFLEECEQKYGPVPEGYAVECSAERESVVELEFAS